MNEVWVKFIKVIGLRWRVGDNVPKGYVDSGGSGGSGGGGGSSESSSGGGTIIPCNLNCGKLLW